MRAVDVVEAYRIRTGAMGSDASYGMNGAFIVPSCVDAEELRVIASDGTGWPLGGEPWEHVSVSRADRCPVWDEMVQVRQLFWTEKEWVLQFHPPEALNISVHPYCLHMWRPTRSEIPTPPRQTIA